MILESAIKIDPRCLRNLKDSVLAEYDRGQCCLLLPENYNLPDDDAALLAMRTGMQPKYDNQQ